MHPHPGNYATVAFHTHPQFVLGAVAIDGRNGFDIGVTKIVTMPTDDFLVAFVGHGDERSIAAHAPEDSIRLLLVGDIYYFPVGDVFRQQG